MNTFLLLLCSIGGLITAISAFPERRIYRFILILIGVALVSTASFARGQLIAEENHKISSPHLENIKIHYALDHFDPAFDQIAHWHYDNS